MGFTQHHPAFTLIEALTTFIIIGIIAVLVIPSLIKYKNDKETVVSLKKAYNVLSNSYILVRGSNGDINDWGLSEDFEGSKKILNILSPYLKLERRCDGTIGCFKNTKYKYIDNADYTNLNTINNKSKAMFLDGMNFIITSFKDCNNQIGNGKLSKTCGYIDIDINGFKKPNQYGKDTFSFYLTESGIVPVGTQEDLTNTFENNCKTGSGRACTAYILEHDSMWNGEITESPTPVPPSPPNTIGNGTITVDPLAPNAMDWNSAYNYCRSQGKGLPGNDELRQIADKCYVDGKFDPNNPFGIKVGSYVWSTNGTSITSRYYMHFTSSGSNFFNGYDYNSVMVVCVK